jgi:hypothetical protein
MEYAGTVSTFQGALVPPSPGPVTLEILAANPREANFARFRRELTVTAP